MKLIDAPTYHGVALDPVRTNMYGIEIELENYKGGWQWPKNKPGNLYWTLCEDPSLRKGIEMVSHKLSQARCKLALDAAQGSIDMMKLTANSRCGVHVHVNMLNLTWGQMWSFLALYTFIEPEIFSKYGVNDRYENHFCVPMYWNTKMQSDLCHDINLLRQYSQTDLPEDPSLAQKARGVVKRKLHHIQGQGLHSPGNVTFATTQMSAPPVTAPMYGMPGGKRWYPVKKLLTSLGKYKYGAMTLYRMPDLGTVEIRLLPGTTNMKLVAEWVRLIGRIKHQAFKFSEPLDLQKAYEAGGPDKLWASLNVGTRPHVKPSNKDEAEEAAYKIIGTKPTRKEEYEWPTPKNKGGWL